MPKGIKRKLKGVALAKQIKAACVLHEENLKVLKKMEKPNQVLVERYEALLKEMQDAVYDAL